MAYTTITKSNEQRAEQGTRFTPPTRLYAKPAPAFLCGQGQLGVCGMKTVTYIEDGVVQLVITPTSVFERNSLALFKQKPLEVKIFHGSFYDCRGGWTQQESYSPADYNPHESIILTIKENPTDTNKGEVDTLVVEQAS